MTNVARQTGLLVGLILGILSVLATAAFGFVADSPAMIVILFPGLFLSMGVPNSYWLWIAAPGNFCFWFLLCWLTGSLIGRIVKARNDSEAQ